MINKGYIYNRLFVPRKDDQPKNVHIGAEIEEQPSTGSSIEDKDPKLILKRMKKRDRTHQNGERCSASTNTASLPCVDQPKASLNAHPHQQTSTENVNESNQLNKSHELFVASINTLMGLDNKGSTRRHIQTCSI
ncbi:hypothetical protein RF11_15990 [Thelohanellus kitauei]|uniref:Uncharacterized protein n=1 Tax=Thelohanellus kitauei TaxID=669202 RepID=A0A0C2MHB2_THEKT|nr:hypothetical protein RF11_15990 [Thelohanellus kitauei]